MDPITLFVAGLIGIALGSSGSSKSRNSTEESESSGCDTSPIRFCKYNGCFTVVSTVSDYCPKHRMDSFEFSTSLLTSYCKQPGCFERVQAGSSYCSEHRVGSVGLRYLSSGEMEEFRGRYWKSKGLTTPATNPCDQYWQSKGLAKPGDIFTQYWRSKGLSEPPGDIFAQYWHSKGFK